MLPTECNLYVNPEPQMFFFFLLHCVFSRISFVVSFRLLFYCQHQMHWERCWNIWWYYGGGVTSFLLVPILYLFELPLQILRDLPGESEN